jgi:betaine-aldehyde dehydrogenase
MRLQSKLFIGGAFVDASERATIATLNPHDNSVLAEVAEARREDIDRAVVAARTALPAWSAMAAADRGRLLLKLAERIEAELDELARLETLDTGHPIRDTRGLDMPRTAATFRYFGGMADKYQGSVVPVEAGFLNYVQRVPVGVVGQIVPWNFPLMFTSWKMGPALAAGNTVVLKPAELTPLSALRIGELMAEIGIPPGVVNIVPGYGAIAGQYLAEHPGVDKIAFTGSTATGGPPPPLRTVRPWPTFSTSWRRTGRPRCASARTAARPFARSPRHLAAGRRRSRPIPAICSRGSRGSARRWLVSRRAAGGTSSA